MFQKGSEFEIFQVDAFTDRPFSGNPAAVCLTRGVLPGNLMRKIAAEMNLSETAFLLPIDGNLRNATKFRIRWLAPSWRFPLRACDPCIGSRNLRCTRELCRKPFIRVEKRSVSRSKASRRHYS